MSLFAAGAPQISAMEPRIRKSQFHVQMTAAIASLCPGTGLPRNDVTLHCEDFAL
jgi:hypothetical protein